MHTEPLTEHAPASPLPPASGETETTEQEPTLATAGTTKARCTGCGHAWTWTTDPLELCPDCGGELIVTAATGHTVEEAIARAAQELPDRIETSSGGQPVQPRIPGLMPAFNWEAMGRSILETRAEVKELEAIEERKHSAYKYAKKDREEKQTELSKLEDDFAERVTELEAEMKLTPAERRARGCLYERTTGQLCPTCRQRPDHRDDNGIVRHLAQVAVDLADAGQLNVQDGVTIMRQVTGIALDPDVVAGWAPEARRDVLAWLIERDEATRPEILGRPHVVGANQGNACTACGALLFSLAAAHGLERWPEGQLVGCDCPGEPRDTPQELQHLLAQAGATVSQDDIAGWGTAEFDAAAAWAREQIEANEEAEEGTQVSVRWPAHVSAAHHGKEAARRPMRRHASPKAAAKAKQAASKPNGKVSATRAKKRKTRA